MKDLFNHEIADLPPKIKRGFNPCLSLYGPGPAGKTCKECIHLQRFRNFLKCALRKRTYSSATDHKAGYPACGRYEKARKELEVLPSGAFK